MTKSRQEIHNNRPTSPHLSIYKPQISSVLSILHRLTGVALFFGLSTLVWWFVLWVFSKFNHYYIELSHHILFTILLFMVSLAWFYHFCTGIRHLIWDMGYGFSIKSINKSGLTAVVMSIIFTVIFWIYIKRGN